MSAKKVKNKDDIQPMPEAQGLPVTIHAQYVRDISFENPDAPNSLRSAGGAPDMNVNISMDAREIEDKDIENLYEVALTLSATAMRDEKILFIAEVIYGITVSVGDVVPQEQHHPLLLIEIPRLAFPFARQILATMTSQGGFPPLLLNPVDFEALYLDRFKDEIEAARAEAEGSVN